MRYYVKCSHCAKKFYLSTKAKHRSELPSTFSLTCPFCKNQAAYSNYDVFTEPVKNTSAAGALAGGLVGLAFGGVGAVVGAVIGAALGGSQEKIDNDASKEFNKS